MSRLRRVELHSRFFFITCNLKPGRRVPFVFCGYCFMPDHWHAIFLPGDSTSISDILMRIKIATFRRISTAREDPQPIWQSRFYDHIGARNSIKLSSTFMRIPRQKAWLKTSSIGSGPVQLGMRIEPVRLKWTMSVSSEPV